MQAGSGFLSQHTKTLHFGLDQAPGGRARITWPSGLIQEFGDLEAGFVHTLTEGSDGVVRTPFRPRQAGFGPGSPGIEPVVGENTPARAPAWLLEAVPLPDDRKGPGFVCITAGPGTALPADVPVDVIDLDRESPDVAAMYALFQRYLFDWRTDFRVPLVLLVDERGLCHKIYPELPDGNTFRGDLRQLHEVLAGRQITRETLALPFRGRYYSPPARKFFQMGAAFYSAGYPGACAPVSRSRGAGSPSNFKALLSIGQIHLEAERYGPAREYLERARVLNDRSAALWNCFGGLDAGQGRLHEAIAAYEKASSLQPDLVDVLVNAGLIYARLEQFGAAEQKLRRALEVNPADAEAANQLGLVFARQNRGDEARRWLQQAIESKRTMPTRSTTWASCMRKTAA